MSKRFSLAAVAMAGIVAAATLSVAQSPLGKNSPDSPRSRLTSAADSPLDASRGSLRGSVIPGSDLPGSSSRGSSSSGTGIIRIEHALVTSLDPIKLPARDAGAIQSITMKKGNEVKENEIIGQLDDKDSLTKKKIAELERDAAKVQAESDAQIDAAKKGEEVTRQNYLAYQEADRKQPGAVAPFDMRRSLFEWQRAQAQIAVAEVEKAVAQATMLAKEGQIEGAENEIERRKIVAPIDGIVTEIYKHKGEWCQPGDPILEIVRMDRVEIEGFVYAADASPAKILGKPVEVVVQLAGGETYKTTGTVTFASPLLEGAGQMRRFHISTEIDNKKDGAHWVIQPGTEAEMVINLSPPPAPKPVVAPRTGAPARLRPSLPGTKVEVQRPAVPDLKADTKSKVEGKTDLKSESNSKTDGRTDSKVKADEKSDAKTDSKTKPKSDSEAESSKNKDNPAKAEPIKAGDIKSSTSDAKSKSAPATEKSVKLADENNKAPAKSTTKIEL